MSDITKTLAELDRLHADATPGPWVAREYSCECCSFIDPKVTYVTNGMAALAPFDSDYISALHNAYPALRSHIAELEAKAAGFDLIRDLFHRFDTRFAGARDQVLLTDDLLERTREAIESAVKKETE